MAQRSCSFVALKQSRACSKLPSHARLIIAFVELKILARRRLIGKPSLQTASRERTGVWRAFRPGYFVAISFIHLGGVHEQQLRVARMIDICKHMQSMPRLRTPLQLATVPSDRTLGAKRATRLTHLNRQPTCCDAIAKHPQQLEYSGSLDQVGEPDQNDSSDKGNNN